MSCSYASEIKLLGCAQRTLDAVGNIFQSPAQITFNEPIARLCV